MSKFKIHFYKSTTAGQSKPIQADKYAYHEPGDRYVFSDGNGDDNPVLTVSAKDIFYIERLLEEK